MIAEEPASILLVDDRPENLLALEAVLSSLQLDLVRACSGPEALDRLREQEFAVVLLDVQMPGMDGFETAKRIRSDERAKNTPIILLTAIYLDQPYRSQGFAAGAIDYLTKPFPIEELRSKVAAFVELWRDTRRARRKVQALTSAILESALDAIVVVDAGGHVVEWNPAAERIFGYSPGEAIGRPMAALIIPPSLQEHHRLSFARYLATGESRILGRRVEFTARRADGAEFPVEVAVTRVPSGEPPLFAAYCRDITELKETREALRERAEALLNANRRKDEFLAMLSHELRNPLSAIGNAVEVLNHVGSQDEASRRVCGLIERQVRHLGRMVDDLLDVSRLVHGTVDLRRETVDLETVVRQAVETCRMSIDIKGHTLTLSLPAEPVALDADAARLCQIICNLLDNAAKYTDPGGAVSLTAARVEVEGAPWVELRVKDTGIGISPELLPHAFDLFTQAERSLDRSQGGLGIGLTLVKRLTELHGGTVEALSSGQGSEFVVRLPALKAEVRRTKEEGAGPEPLPPSRRVLVVDDNADAAETLADLLVMWGHQPYVAHDGASAIAAAEHHTPDVVLLDIGLPGVDGYEVARQLRARMGSKQPRLIALTGYGQDDDRRKTRDAGFDAHLVKPVDLQELQRQLRALAIVGE